MAFFYSCQQVELLTQAKIWHILASLLSLPQKRKRRGHNFLLFRLFQGISSVAKMPLSPCQTAQPSSEGAQELEIKAANLTDLKERKGVLSPPGSLGSGRGFSGFWEAQRASCGCPRQQSRHLAQETWLLTTHLCPLLSFGSISARPLFCTRGPFWCKHSGQLLPPWREALWTGCRLALPSLDVLARTGRPPRGHRPLSDPTLSFSHSLLGLPTKAKAAPRDFPATRHARRERANQPKEGFWHRGRIRERPDFSRRPSSQLQLRPPSRRRARPRASGRRPRPVPAP